jgi:hypothetical protein
MTDTFIKFYYGALLAACLVILGEMAVVGYRGLVLPSAEMCLVLAALALVLVGDWYLQICIERGSPD